MAESLFNETRRYLLEKMYGIWREGGRKLPTEKELTKEVLASYGTIRLVMTSLESEGFIRKIRGSGTYLEAGAGKLLEAALRTRLRLFTSPLSGNADTGYADYLVAELTRQAHERQYRVETHQVMTHDEFLAGLSREAESRDPVIYLPPTEAFTMLQLGKLGRFDKLPLVVIDCELGDINVTNITTDNRKGGMLAARALLDNGCRRLALLQCEPNLRQIRQRIQGFTEIAELSGISVDIWDCKVGVNDDRGRAAYRQTCARLRSGRPPDGLFAISDFGALHAMKALREAGLSPGEDIALIGFDGLPAGRKHTPTLGSVAQPVAEIGCEVFALLDAWRPGVHIHKLLAPKLQTGATLSNKEMSPA